MLILEGAQAGLSWYTILKRRDGYRKAFKNFDVAKCAKMTDAELEKVLATGDIIRNRQARLGVARRSADRTGTAAHTLPAGTRCCPGTTHRGSLVSV